MFRKTTERWRRLVVRRIRRRPLLPFLAAATVMLIVCLLFADRSWGEFCLPIGLAEAGLIGLWLGRLHSGWWLKFPLAAPLLLGASLPVSVVDRQPMSEVVTVMSLYAGGVAAVSCAIAVARRWLARSLGTTRFSVGTMLIATTVIACLTTLLRFADLPGSDPVNLALALGTFAMLPIAINALASRERGVIPLSIGVLGSSTVVWIVLELVEPDAEGEWFWLIQWMGFFIALWLRGLKSRGVRIAKQATPTEADTPASLATSDNIDLQA